MAMSNGLNSGLGRLYIMSYPQGTVAMTVIPTKDRDVSLSNLLSKYIGDSNWIACGQSINIKY